MFAKPFSLVLVYILTIFNILILVSPIIAASLPFISIESGLVSVDYDTYQRIKFSICFVIFLVSFLMLIYLVFDFLFGFSVRSSLKGCTPYEKVKDYDFLTDLFNQVKSKFGERNVRLYIKKSDEINAYAISSLGTKAIVLTRGLIDHYLASSPDPKIFLYALRSVIGHEMSHLINKDFLPTFLIIVNQKVTNFISKIFHYLFSLGMSLARFTPYIGTQTVNAISWIYSLFNFLITAFNRLIVYNIYEFLRRGVMRFVEYRCDHQSAKAFGGQNMALALSMLGESGYFTLFSTHPRTKSRINRVKNIKISDSIIHARFFDGLANYFALMFLPIICLYFAKQAHIDLMVREYVRNHETINRKVMTLWHLMSKFF
ncbi:MAG: M48 family metalloprotease [Proteobacteria bacterium]|nr:M48 family metalloprotease [Pseudomonadota bacterium]